MNKIILRTTPGTRPNPADIGNAILSLLDLRYGQSVDYIAIRRLMDAQSDPDDMVIIQKANVEMEIMQVLKT